MSKVDPVYYEDVYADVITNLMCTFSDFPKILPPNLEIHTGNIGKDNRGRPIPNNEIIVGQMPFNGRVYAASPNSSEMELAFFYSSKIVIYHDNFIKWVKLVFGKGGQITREYVINELGAVMTHEVFHYLTLHNAWKRSYHPDTWAIDDMLQVTEYIGTSQEEFNNELYSLRAQTAFMMGRENLRLKDLYMDRLFLPKPSSRFFWDTYVNSKNENIRKQALVICRRWYEIHARHIDMLKGRKASEKLWQQFEYVGSFEVDDAADKNMTIDKIPLITDSKMVNEGMIYAIAESL